MLTYVCYLYLDIYDLLESISVILFCKMPDKLYQNFLIKREITFKMRESHYFIEYRGKI